MRRESLWLLVMMVSACGDGLNQGPADSRNLGAPPPIQIGSGNYNDRPDCYGATQVGCEDSKKCGIVGQEWACLDPGGQDLNQACRVGAQGDDCQAGLHCYQGSCHALCANSAPCNASDAFCVPIPSRADQLSICLSSCSAIDQDCPKSGAMARQGCYLYVAGPVCAPVAKSPPGVPGAACTYLNECAIGSGCVDIDGTSTCRAYCDHENNAYRSDPRCSTEGLCRPLEGSNTVGICQP